MFPRLEVLPGQNGWEAGQFPHPSPTSRQRLDIHPSPSLNSHNALVDVQEGSMWISQTIWFQELGNSPSALLLPCPSTGTWSPHFPCCLALSSSSLTGLLFPSQLIYHSAPSAFPHRRTRPCPQFLFVSRKFYPLIMPWLLLKFSSFLLLQSGARVSACSQDG